MSAEAAVPNPVTLAPFRTFRDVAQPASLFVLRVQGGGETPNVALFEADGGAWRLAAIENIKKWLEENITGEVEVLA